MTPALSTARYSRPWSCTHRRFARLVNGEVACLKCMHVVVRVDGSAVSYPTPALAKALEALAALVDEAVAA